MNRIQSKNHRIGTCQINLFVVFDGKIHVLDNGIDVLALGAQS